MRIESYFSALLLTVGCSAGPVTHYQSSQPAPSAKPDAAPAPVKVEPKSAPVTLDMAGSAAPWLEVFMRDGIDDPLAPAMFKAAGNKIAVVQARGGYFALGPKGVNGPLPVPAHTVWVGVGGRGDQLLAATDAGDLYRASYPVATRAVVGPAIVVVPAAARSAGQPLPAPFTKFASVPGATGWDAVPGWIVAAVGADVRVSRNGSARFRRRRVVRGGVVESVFVRADGAIVARVATASAGSAPAHVVYQAKTRGRFRRAPFQAKRLVRTGAQIHDGDGTCAVALAADGAQWALAPAELPGTELAGWSELVAHGELARLLPPRRRQTATVPAAPTVTRGAGLTGPDKQCVRAEHNAHGLARAQLLDRSAKVGGLLVSVSGTRGPKPRITRTETGLLRDVECGLADVVGGECKDAALPRGKAHVAVIDRKRGTVRIVDAPAGCTPVRVTSLHGISLLRCKDHRNPSNVTVRALDGDRFVPEVSAVPNPEGDSAVAADGTIGLYAPCGSSACVWVRRPVAVGVKDAWRLVNVPRAHAYRVLPNGRVLALARVGAVPKLLGAPEVIQFVLDTPGLPQSTVATGVRVNSVVHEFSVAADGRILLVLEDAGTDTKQRTVYVATDGRLVDVTGSALQIKRR